MSGYDPVLEPPRGTLEATPVSSGLCGLAVPTHGPFDAGKGLSKVMLIHGRPNRDLRVERQKPWLGDGG